MGNYFTDKFLECCRKCKHYKNISVGINKKVFACSLNCNLLLVTTFGCKKFEKMEEKKEIKLIDNELLYNIIERNKSLCEKYAQHLNDAMIAYGITSTNRIAGFIATIAVESGYLRYTTELGSRDYFYKYEPNTKKGKALGNKEPGDGYKFRGRGLIQVTGRHNYEQVAVRLGIDCLEHPELLSELPYSVTTACWWWQSHGCNELADEDNPTAIRQRVNGGMNGYQEFMQIYSKAKKILQ